MFHHKAVTFLSNFTQEEADHGRWLQQITTNKKKGSSPGIETS